MEEVFYSLMSYLHSNMVRFIIKMRWIDDRKTKAIYIPIWLDLLFDLSHNHFTTMRNLHSNMVRFIIITCSQKDNVYREFTFQYG